MALEFTTTDALLRRLSGRGSVGSSVFGPAQIDPLLIQQIGEQVEARIKDELGKIYKFPLTRTHIRLQEIAELGIICELLPTHFIQQQNNPHDNFQVFSCKQFKNLLADIISGELPLDGELFIGDSLVPNPKIFSKVAQLNPGTAHEIVW